MHLHSTRPRILNKLGRGIVIISVGAILFITLISSSQTVLAAEGNTIINVTPSGIPCCPWGIEILDPDKLTYIKIESLPSESPMIEVSGYGCQTSWEVAGISIGDPDDNSLRFTIKDCTSDVFETYVVPLQPEPKGQELNPILGAAYIIVNPDTINVNQDTDFKVCAGNTPIHVIDAMITNPAGDSFFDVFGEIDIPTNICQKWDVSDDFEGLSIDMPGTYLVDVNTDSSDFSSEFGVSFFVIPESPIGVAALMGSSLAAFGGFMFWKRRSNSQPHSLGDLGI